VRVAIFTATSEWGGAENHAIGLANVLKKRAHEVIIVELGHTVYSQHGDVSSAIGVHHLSLPRSLEHLGFLESWRLLKSLDSEVAVFEKGELDSANWKFDLAARVCFKRYISVEQLICAPMPPKVSRKHFGVLPGVNLWWHQTYWRRRARSLAPQSVVCVSEAVRSRLVKHYHFPPGKTQTIYNGIDTSMFQPNTALKAKLRRGWEIPDGDFVFGAVGRLAPVKAYDLAIAAFKELRSIIKERHVWLVLVGDGPSIGELKRLTEISGLQQIIKLPGVTDRPWEVYPALDVFLMPSRLEGLPHALLEAMASGCPAIATAVGGIPEVIKSPSMGWVVSEGNRNEFVAAMLEAVTSSSETLIEMGRRAREHVLAHFNSDVLLQRLADLIEFGPKSLISGVNTEGPVELLR
jgi:glycosyltransferase involved in cell wall biosynthesis